MGNLESADDDERTFYAAGVTFEEACTNLELLIRCRYDDRCRVSWKYYWDLKDRVKRRRLFVTIPEGRLYVVRSQENKDNKIQCVNVTLPSL